MKKLTLKSYAKLNLCLQVINKRRDNYHNLITLFERISLHDILVLKLRRDNKINLISDSQEIPRGRSNLAYRSAELLQRHLSPDKGVDIRIIKRIPVGGGLGGGSSNAAFVLLGLNKLWKLGLTVKELARFAGKIGSDVPFFIYGCPFAVGSGRGEIIKPLNPLKKLKLWHVLVAPRIHVSTPFIFNEWDKNKGKNNIKVGLTIGNSNVKILSSALRKKDLFRVKEALFNSLQESAVKKYPVLAGIRRSLEIFGLECISMSGSGPSIFAIARNKREAFLAFRRLKANKLWQVHAVRTA